MGLITQSDIEELEIKLEDLKAVKDSKETEKTASLEDGTRTFEDITNRNLELNKVKSDIELNAKLQEDFSKLVDEKGALLDTTINSEKENSSSREALQIKLDTSFKEQDAKTLEKKGREEKKLDLEQSLTDLNQTIAKMQADYDAMADGAEKDELLLKIQDAQAKASDVSNSVTAETTAIAALQAELDTLSTSIEADNAAMKALEMEHKAIADLLAKTETELADAKMARKQAIEEGADMAMEKQTIEDNLDTLNEEYSKIKSHVKKLESEVSDIEQEIKNVEESDLLQQFEEEQTARKRHAKNTIKNKGRIKVLLRDQNATVEDKLDEFNSDSEIFIKDIKAELEFTPEAEDKLERIQSALDGTDSLFTASQAFNLASESIYSTKAIVEKIKKACYQGITSIKLLDSEITGTQILMLNKVGYKITHESLPQPGDIEDIMVVIVDWGFVQAN